MAIQAVRLMDAENLVGAVLDIMSLNIPSGVGVMCADGVHARVVGIGLNGEIKVDYPEVAKAGDMVIIRDRKDW
jgi:sporulation protein YlmC with PRC-barrel domain